MNKIAILFLFLFTSMMTWGQSNEQNFRIVFLNDGSVLKGYLTTDQPEDGIKVKMQNGLEASISNKFIKKIKSPKRRLKYIGEGLSIKPQGLYGALHTNTLLGYAASQNEENKAPRLGLGLHFVLGHKYSEKIALGIGTGLDAYPSNLLMPIYMDIRGVWAPTPSRINFAYNLAVGYSFHTGIFSPNNDFDTWKGGVMIYPNVGIRIARRKQANILLDIGYKFQYSTRQFSSWWNTGETIDKIWYKNLVFRVGWEF